ncbi:hypothetical protein ER308_18085 [Egibacter rhizosphaerae]|uniref:LysM domain-containing protein n=1 Tax=Egibacter rhizosphaerae TaxID=1670831 RepID=A0A411YJJ1_9ACTN|nr:hypothetical protein [Egibacter rhizosphaerae]QBI21292.1 hypothetical protein ER308_18085 [Egibacter rhizosphaerae]
MVIEQGFGSGQEAAGVAARGGPPHRAATPMGRRVLARRRIGVVVALGMLGLVGWTGAGLFAAGDEGGAAPAALAEAQAAPAPSDAPAGVRASEVDGGIVVVGEGETLWELAPAEVDPQAWAGEVAAHNEVEPTEVRAGQPLRVPPGAGEG